METQPFISDILCKEYRCSSGFICDFSKAPRPKYVIAFMLRGTATFYTQNHSFTINEGDILFIPMGQCYISEWQSKSSSTLCYSFHFSIMHSRSPFLNKSAQIQGIYNCSEFNELFSKVNKQINSSNVNDNIAGIGNFYTLFSLVYGKLKIENSITNKDIQIARNYIEMNYKSRINMEELAKSCNMSVANFYRKFKSQYLTTPTNYKNILLVENAIELLLSNPEESIDSISDQLGFESTTYFRKLFKKSTGQSPHEYRKYRQNGLYI